MKLKSFKATGAVVSILATVWACGDAGQGAQPLAQEEAALVAAVAASEDASDDATSSLGAEPFWVKGCGFGAIVSQIHERFDGDGDGTLSGEERAAIAQQFGDPVDRVALLLSLYDADSSGALDATELGQLQSDVQARCEQREASLLARFDTDGDGQLSDAERAAAREALRERWGRGHHHGGRGAGDAGVSDDDDSPRDRRDRVRDRFDTDGDGELSRDERRAFGEHVRGCVRGDHPLDPGAEPVPPADEPSDEPAADAGPL